MIVYDEPATEPVTLAEARLALNHDDYEHDELIGDILIPAARSLAESHTGMTTVERTATLKLDKFPSCIDFYAGPVQSIDSITYQDADDVTQPFIEFYSSIATNRVRIKPNDSWPSTRSKFDAVTVTMTIGYPVVPKQFKQAIIMLVGDMFENREAREPMKMEPNETARLLLNQYRVWPF